MLSAFKRALVPLLLASACASKPQAVGATTPAAQAPAPAAAVASLSQPDLIGSWAEFWSPAGCADTEHYELAQDGHFDWRAPAGSEAAVTRRSGHWSLQGGPAPALRLRVEAEEQRFGCEASAACRVTHDPPVEQQLALGDCPENEEARALDASYRCLSIDGRAFWLIGRGGTRRPSPSE